MIATVLIQLVDRENLHMIACYADFIPFFKPLQAVLHFLKGVKFEWCNS
jgi:hypothetical protein